MKILPQTRWVIQTLRHVEKQLLAQDPRNRDALVICNARFVIERLQQRAEEALERRAA